MASTHLPTLACTSCHYTALVIPERQFVESCDQEMDTVECAKCHQLSIVPFTKVGTYPRPTREEFNLIYEANKKNYHWGFEFAYRFYDPPMVCEELKKISCLWCNSTRTKSWNYAQAHCPKCGGKMEEVEALPFDVENVLTSQQLETAVNASPRVIAVYLDEWCVACRILKQVIHQITEDYPGYFHFVKIDVDFSEKYALFKKYKLKSYPFLMCYQLGEVMEVFVFPDSKVKLIKKLKKHYDLPSIE